MSNSAGKIKDKKTKKSRSYWMLAWGACGDWSTLFPCQTSSIWPQSLDGRSDEFSPRLAPKHQLWYGSRCSLSHTSLVGLATTASIASPSRSWLLSGQQQVVSGEVGEASRPVSLVSTFSALWPAPKAGHLGWGEPGHHRLHQVRPFFSSVWLGQWHQWRQSGDGFR